MILKKRNCGKNMKFKNTIFILLFLLVALLCLNSVAASDLNDNNLTQESSELDLDEGLENMELSISAEDSTLSEPKIHYVDEIGQSHNEMNEHTIKKVMDEANAGDTIVINGNYYEHCHLVIDKPLTIMSTVGTTLSPCSSSMTSNHQGIFYITSKASGTVINGFTFVDNLGLSDSEAYGILVKGASDVTIANCSVTTDNMADSIRFENSKDSLIENVTVFNSVNGVKISNSENIAINNVIARNSEIGINIIDSTRMAITSSNITKNKNSGIAFSGKGSDLSIMDNNITENGNGINITSPDHAYILSNLIGFNKQNGVYIDNPITLVEIKGNFFNQNVNWEIFNDFHVRDSAFAAKGNKLEVINNNYMINYGSGSGTADVDRPVWTQMYEYKKGLGSYNYDSDRDVYVYVGSGGDYDGHQDKMFIAYTFEINEYMHCPNTYYAPKEIWAMSGNYELQLSEITQVKKGIYQISIVDENGNVAGDLSSVPVTFYLNKLTKSSAPTENDTYKTVWLKNGTTTVRFYADEFKETGNVITAVFPTPGTNIDDKVSKKFNVDDSNIPGEVLNTKISLSSLSTFPKSGEELIANLTDINGKPISGETLVFTIGSYEYNQTTDENGQAIIKVSISKEGTYAANVKFAGDDLDYYGSDASSSVVVKKVATKITSSNVYMVPKLAEYYYMTLKDASNKAISNQKITVKVNGKTYTPKTNGKGVAKVKLKFTKNKKTYTISIKYAGNDKYKAISKSSKITVKYSSKTAKLVTPTVTIPPKTNKYYTVTLKDANGKGIAKQKITLKINGKTFTKTTNSKGQTKIKVKFTALKNYKVSASYKGSKIYKKASSSGKIKVAKTATKITAPSVSALPKEAKAYTITLKTSAGKALSKQKVTIKVNDKTYTKTTNAKGKASISVKFTNEKAYSVAVNYKGTAIYKASKATGKITVSRIDTQIESHDRTFSRDSQDEYKITLKDKSGNALAGQLLSYSIGNESYSQSTDANGQIRISLTNKTGDSFDVMSKFAGNSKYKAVSKSNKITIVNRTNITFIDAGLPNDEIQDIMDSASNGANVEFLGDNYTDVALTVNKNLIISPFDKTVLQAKEDSPAFTIAADNVKISNFTIVAGSGDAIDIVNAKNVVIDNNVISNAVDDAKMESYLDGSVMLPGHGIGIAGSADVELLDNDVRLFESAIFAEDSSDIVISNNDLRENNYGIKYGFGVSNTEITNNTIYDNIGLYIMTVPEGPSGYGIFLNNSAVNVTITHNHIFNNHMGISLDAKNSTGIVITQNTITDNVLEGIRFNAPYDLAENAVDVLVTDNAIYRNARGPSMMILGELSANPEGIYGGGVQNPEERLKLDPNWYGASDVATWDIDSGIVGYGTMCPRISTTGITFNVTSDGFGNYFAVFYKKGELASNLPEFDMYATLNRGSDKQIEVNFNVVDGVGSFNFDAGNYNNQSNIIEISVGSLLNSTSRVFAPAYSYDVPASEIITN